MKHELLARRQKFAHLVRVEGYDALRGEQIKISRQT